MWRKRRSALFFDFENVPTKTTPEAVSALVAWLEDGKFDEAAGKRKLVSKRIYWNSAAEKHREAFEAAGFDVVLCEKFSTMKNGADIRMALDIAEMCWKVPDVKEYILFTTDSDFVPVLQRLTEKSKISAILVDEQKSASHTAFKIFADVVLPTRYLSDALTYKRPPKGLLPKLRPSRAAPVSTPGTQKALNGAPMAAKAPAAAPPAKIPDEPLENPIDQAVRAVVRLSSRTPKAFVARRSIEGQLQQIKGFKKNGPTCYLGQQHYQGLMAEIAKRDKRIKVRPGRNNSASVMYEPEA